ncbi:MAG: head-tail adaptor protein [Gemmatimonadales bacterium]|nr:head-tail adaptor protein [Gemmatimonadales bacterium]
MRAGLLRDLMAIEAHNGHELRSGEPSPDGWHEFAQVWGGFGDQGGNTVDLGGLQVAEHTAALRIRYTAGVTPAMRVRWVDGARVRLYEIESVVNVGERREETMLRVRELAPASNDPALASLPVALVVE